MARNSVGTKGRGVRILMSGFGPFGRFRRNPSETVVRTFDVGALESLAGCRVHMTKIILPVHTDTFDVLSRKVGRKRFDIAIHLGLGTRSSMTRIERTGINLMRFSMPDIRGNRFSNVPIIPGGPKALRSTLPIKAMARALSREGLGYMLSDDAGGYICNLILYRSLERMARPGWPSLVGFIHVPRTSEQPLGTTKKAIAIIVTQCVRHFLKGIS